MVEGNSKGRERNVDDKGRKERKEKERAKGGGGIENKRQKTFFDLSIRKL